MPLEFIRAQKKQKVFMILLILVLVLIFAILQKGFFKKPIISSVAPARIYRDISIDINSIENNQFFKTAQPFQEIQPFTGLTGRSNPFVSY